MKETWCNIRYLMNTRKRGTNLQTLNFNNRILHTPESVVSAFGEYFSTVANKLDNDIPRINKSPLDYLRNPCRDSFFVSPCTLNEVKTLVMSTY